MPYTPTPLETRLVYDRYNMKVDCKVKLASANSFSYSLLYTYRTHEGKEDVA